jgi:hypothetical protein
MTMRRTLPLAIAIFALLQLQATFSKGQTPQVYPLPSDSQAVTIVNNAIAQMGGVTVWSTVQDITVNANCTAYDINGDSLGLYTLVWVQAASQFRYDSTVSGTTSTLASGFGNPAMSNGQSVVPWSLSSSNAVQPVLAPALMLYMDTQNPAMVYQYRGTGNVGGQAVNIVAASLSGNVAPVRSTEQDWFISSSTNLPVQVTTRVPTELDPSITISAVTTYSSFAPLTSAPNMQSPVLVTQNFGVGSNTCTLSSPTLNTSPPASYFELLPSGGGL